MGVVVRVPARDPRYRWAWPTRLLVPLFALLTLVAVLLRDYDRAQVYVLCVFVLLLADDTAKLRARVRALEETVEELIET